MVAPRLLLAACLAFPALARAQDPAPAATPAAAKGTKASKAAPNKRETKPPPQDVPPDAKDDHDEPVTLKESYARQRDGIKELGAKQDAAEEAVEKDKSLSRAQKKSKLAAIQKDFRLRRNALRDKFNEERKKLRSEKRKDFWHFRKKTAP